MASRKPSTTCSRTRAASSPRSRCASSQNASKSEFPHLYATPPDEKYHAWGSGTDIGLERMRSDSLQVRLRGVALWLTVAYHETKDSQFAEQQELHRQVMRAMRALKDSIPAAELNQLVRGSQ